MALLFKKQLRQPLDDRQFDGLTKAQQAYALTHQEKKKNSTKSRQFLEHHVGVPIHEFKSLDSFMRTGCKNVWATFRSCHIVASVVTSTKFKIQNSRSGDTLDSGPFFDLWSNPNSWDSINELLYQWTYHMKLTGRAYWVKDEINSQGQPNQLYPLLPQHVSLTPDPVSGVAKYTYRINGASIDFAPEEIIHFRRAHPCDPLGGLGDIEPSQDLYNDFINRNTYEEKFLANGAQPSGILTYKGSDEMPADMSDMDDEEWGKLKKWWQTEYSGKANAGKTALLTGEWEYQRLGLTQQEMSSIERDKSSIEQIFMNHGVPLSLAGWTNAANYATASLDEMNFRRYEVRPLIEILVGKLNQEGVLSSEYGDSSTLNYELSGLVDVEQVHKDYRPLVDAGGMTLNELRVRMGLPEGDNENLNVYFGSRTQVPLEMIGAAAPDDLTLNQVMADTATSPAPVDTQATPPAKPAPDAGASPIADGESAVPQQTLNGAQIASLVAIATQVTEGNLPKDTAIQIISAAFPFTKERATRILQEVMEGEPPKNEPNPFPEPEPDPEP